MAFTVPTLVTLNVIYFNGCALPYYGAGIPPIGSHKLSHHASNAGCHCQLMRSNHLSAQRLHHGIQWQRDNALKEGTPSIF